MPSSLVKGSGKFALAGREAPAGRAATAQSAPGFSTNLPEVPDDELLLELDEDVVAGNHLRNKVAVEAAHSLVQVPNALGGISLVMYSTKASCEGYLLVRVFSEGPVPPSPLAP